MEEEEDAAAASIDGGGRGTEACLRKQRPRLWTAQDGKVVIKRARACLNIRYERHQAKMLRLGLLELAPIVKGSQEARSCNPLFLFAI